METYEEVDIYIQVFLTSAPVGCEWSASRLGCLTPGGRAPGTHWLGGWVDPRSGLDDVERRKILPLPGLQLQPLGRAARSQSLYRLRYPGSSVWTTWRRESSGPYQDSNADPSVVQPVASRYTDCAIPALRSG
jgi:hypothetical protein